MVFDHRGSAKSNANKIRTFSNTDFIKLTKYASSYILKYEKI